jgi:SAM-dependent methyltransferase
VLDVGCSGGRLAEHLGAQGHHVTGVDTIEVDGVRERVHAFHRVDAAGLNQTLAGETFDYIVAGDVIEHLADPLTTLKELRELLDDGGQLLVSVPNFGHWYPRARVLLGVFGYDRRGILDETHLRFFTRSSLKRLVTAAGFDVLDEWHTGNPTEKLQGGRGGTVSGLVGRLGRGLVRLRPELFAYQNVLRCTPHAGSSSTTVFERRDNPGPVRAPEPWVARTA